MTEDELMNYEDNFASGLWEHQERPPCTLSCIHCNKETAYIFPRVWKNLTDDQILEALEVSSAEEVVFRIARAVEAKLKEKNGG